MSKSDCFTDVQLVDRNSVEILGSEEIYQKHVSLHAGKISCICVFINLRTIAHQQHLRTRMETRTNKKNTVKENIYEWGKYLSK